MSAGVKSETGRTHHRQGAVWPTGRELDDARRRPGLASSDGSVVITPHAMGTDLSATPPCPILATYDHPTRTVTLTVLAIVPRSASPKASDVSTNPPGAIVAGVLAFALPASPATTTITVVASPMHGGEMYGTTYRSARWYAGVVHAAIAADIATGYAEWLGDHTADIQLGTVIITSAGALTVRGPAAGGVGGLTYQTVEHSRLSYLFAPPYTGWWQYRELSGRLWWGTPTVNSTSPTGYYVQLAASTTATIYGTVLLQTGTIIDLTDDNTPAAGYDFIEMATVTTDANLRLTTFTPLGWTPTDFIPAGTTLGASGSFTVDGVTYTVQNGRITRAV